MRSCGRPVRYKNIGLCDACYRRKRREDNPEAQLKASREYYSRNREARAAYHAAYAKANPEKFRLAAANRLAQQSGFILTESQWQAIILEQEGCCYYCGFGFEFMEVEHKIPLSRGGVHCLENIVAACQDCNRRKHTKTAEEFFAALGEVR